MNDFCLSTWIAEISFNLQIPVSSFSCRSVAPCRHTHIPQNLKEGEENVEAAAREKASVTLVCQK